MQHNPTKKITWQPGSLTVRATVWFNRLHRQKYLCCERASLWWCFVWRWCAIRECVVVALIGGCYRFGPMRCYRFSDHVEISWDYQDRLALSLLHNIIKPTFKHIIPPACLHLGGPAAVKTAIAWIEKSLQQTPYLYMIRADVKGYYASIDRKILMQLVRQHYNDPRLLGYFEAIVNHSLDDGGVVSTASTGIPLRSSLSNFLGLCIWRS